MDPNNQNHHQLLPPQDPPSYSALPQFPVSHPPPAALTPHHAPSASPSFAGSAAPLQQQQTFETPQSQRQSSTQDQPTRSVKTKSPSSSRRAANSDARLRVFSSTSVQRHRLSNFSLSSEPPVSTTPTRPPDDTPLPDSMKEMLTKMVEWKHRYPVMFSQVLQIFQGGTANSPAESVASTPLSASPSRTHSPPYEPGEDGPIRKQRRVYSLPGSRLKQGLIDGMPDLGKFPLYRRKRRTRKEIQADEQSKGGEEEEEKEGEEQEGEQSKENHEDNDGGMHETSYIAPAQDSHAGEQPFLSPAPEHIAQPVSNPPVRQEVLGQVSLLQQLAPPPIQQQTHQHHQQQQQQQQQLQQQEQQQIQQEPHIRPESASTPMDIHPKTIWPEPKKPAIASAATSYLNSLPFNRNKPCSSDFVLQLIEPNPSYIELCATLESHGFHLNTVHFAKHLLDSVPDLTNSGSYIAPTGTPEEQQQAGHNANTAPETISLL